MAALRLAGGKRADPNAYTLFEMTPAGCAACHTPS